MKNLIQITLLISLTLLQSSCKSFEISPKQGTLIIPPKGEIRLWENLEHASFSLHLENKSLTNSCEVYKVKDKSEKWISPSLLAKSSLDFTVPSDGSVLLKNFSSESLNITYTID